MKKWVIFFCILLGCQTKAAKDKRLDMKTMQTVVWQLMQADEYYTRVSLVDSTWKADKKNIEFYQQIFDLNKVDRVDFYNTIDYLQRHPIEFKELMDSVNELSKREKK
ncbi:MAG: DUF4296 domain-containing protein [Chitinophagia bacterium]|jgi:uncharacterized lipoprotein NlpE involved in copper resistance|nr:DUF4296 domain-containing protein [Chitinophagia bacterium]NCA30586.1 DUF4296 domain-containing protein [Chitinophagia bacterium]NDD15928.1 DUF4296 domain-containing protein [Chitinophagia bacterium]